MIKPNENLAIYWSFAQKRQAIFWSQFYKKEHNIIDPILSRYKFTNCYRAQDRTSQFLIRDVIYRDQFAPEDVFFRILFFKLFNKIETWLKIQDIFTEISLSTFNVKHYNDALSSIKNLGKIYSAAYIMPSGVTSFGSSIKHHNHIDLLDWMLKKEAHKRIWDIKSLSDMYHFFLAMPSLGPFLAFQFAIDIGYSPYTDVSESEYVIAGPGALRGLGKCFDNFNPKKASDYINWVCENQESQFKKYDLDFNYLGERKLQPIDCQNLFCETDKYLRVYSPQLDFKKKRIKQIYKKNKQELNYFFPPKWKVNIKDDL